MRCDAVRRRMSRYLDEGLDAAGRAEVTCHLKVCRVCDTELKEHLRMRDLLRSAGEGIPPMTSDGEDYWREMRQRLARPVVVRPAAWLWKAAPVAAAASLALVAVVGFPRTDSSPNGGMAKAPVAPGAAAVARAPAPAVASAKPDPSESKPASRSDDPAGSSSLSVGLVGAGGGRTQGSTPVRPAAKPQEPEMIWF